MKNCSDKEYCYTYLGHSLGRNYDGEIKNQKSASKWDAVHGDLVNDELYVIAQYFYCSSVSQVSQVVDSGEGGEVCENVCSI